MSTDVILSRLVTAFGIAAALAHAPTSPVHADRASDADSEPSTDNTPPSYYSPLEPAPPIDPFHWGDRFDLCTTCAQRTRLVCDVCLRPACAAAGCSLFLRYNEDDEPICSQQQQQQQNQINKP